MRAGLLPGQKADAITELTARYGPVAMVGDGINDGPALATASVGVAMGVVGSDVALGNSRHSTDVRQLEQDPYRHPVE